MGRGEGAMRGRACTSPAMLMRWCRLGVPVHVLDGGAFDCGGCDGCPIYVTAMPAKAFYDLSCPVERNTSLLSADSSTLHRPSNNTLPYARRALTGHSEGAILSNYLVFEKWIAW